MRFIKETIGLILIIVFVIIMEIITTNVTNNSLSEINIQIKKIEDENGNIKENIEKLSKDWENEEKWLACYIAHNELKEISDIINQMEFYEANNKNDLIAEKINDIKFKMKKIKNSQSLKLENIF